MSRVGYVETLPTGRTMIHPRSQAPAVLSTRMFAIQQREQCAQLYRDAVAKAWAAIDAGDDATADRHLATAFKWEQEIAHWQSELNAASAPSRATQTAAVPPTAATAATPSPQPVTFPGVAGGVAAPDQPFDWQTGGL